MTFSQVLFKTNTFEFKIQHLLLIGILCLAFTISFLIRAEPIKYGYQLNEFDPFFNFRATKFLLDNGLTAYQNWNDELSWYPNGRDVSASSQVILHATTAGLYSVFGGGGSLYEFTILFPIIIGSLTAIIVFALVRVLAGTSAGLFASLFFAIAPSIIVRGTAGWFKSEPLGLFYGLLGLFLFLNALHSKNSKISVFKLIGGGILLAFGLASWGGIQFLIIPLGMFFFTLPFLRNDPKFTLWAIPLFSASILITASIFERPGIQFSLGLGGISLILPSLFIIISYFIQIKSSQKNKKRNTAIFLLGIIVFSMAFLVINAESQIIPLPSFRYLNAINPFLTTSDSLVDSVSEHATNSINQSFFFLSFLMILGGIGIWIIFKNLLKNYSTSKNDLLVFMLIFGLTGVYASSSFIRLELFSSLSIIILASYALSHLTTQFFSSKTRNKKSQKIFLGTFVTIMIFFITTPMFIPGQVNWSTIGNSPPTILNGGSKYVVSTNDWIDTLSWIKNNTPKDAVIASWWDYGYWIETLGERRTFDDNATIDSIAIKNMAKIFFSTPEDAWKQLKEMDADYVLIFVSGQQLNTQNPVPLYLLDGGGEESKMPWLLRISGEDFSKFIHDDQQSGTDYFWQNSLLGNMIPYSPVLYTDGKTQSQTYQLGMFPVYAKNIKYPEDGNGPFRLVYASSSFNNPSPVLVGVLVYQVNSNYIPQSNQ